MEINIDRIGSLGDGMGLFEGKPVFVAGTLPGETVEATGTIPHLDLQQVLKPSPERVAPSCQHFGTCGGCVLQHASPTLMLDWKQAEVALAFSKMGINVQVEPTIPTSPSSRRRVAFTAKRIDGRVALGFKERGEQYLVDISECTILLPELQAEISPLKDLVKTLLRGNEEIQIAINLCDNGFDLDFSLDTLPSEDMTAAFVRSMAKTRYLRASFNRDVVVETEKPIVRFGNAQVALPPGAFLQAVSEAEQAMADLVCKHLWKRKRVADLFSGSGTFALRLARRSKTHAVEMQAKALSALQSSPPVEGSKSVTTEQRDLFELPMTTKELSAYDGVCIDPPRSGAAEQIKEIAKADIRSVAYVSCNPTSLAKDAKTLIDGGYTLERVIPIDQFVYSPHIEVVSLFSKAPNKAKRSIFR